MFFFSSDKMEPSCLNRTFNSFCTNKCLEEAVDGVIQCNCGEDTPIYDWVWHDPGSTNIKMSKKNREVLFHPIYSSGTAMVRGDKPFKQNCHYYWEIKILSKLYGTDVMIGVGTRNVNLEEWKFKFSSFLGIDAESWGFSYHGNIQNDRLRRKYGTPFGLGSILGVHLDMYNGTLQYFLNRKPLGIAFRNLKHHELYPMVCSTAAQSSIRVTCCLSMNSSLEMMCLRRIMDHPALYQEYKKIPGLHRLHSKNFFWMHPTPDKDVEEKKRLAELDEEVTLSLVGGRLKNKNKKNRCSAIFFYPEAHDYLKIERIFPEKQGPSTSGESSSSSDRGESTSSLNWKDFFEENSDNDCEEEFLELFFP